MEKLFMQKMKSKHLKDEGFKGLPKLFFNILYFPIFLGLNVPLLFLNILFKRI